VKKSQGYLSGGWPKCQRVETQKNSRKKGVMRAGLTKVAEKKRKIPGKN